MLHFQPLYCKLCIARSNVIRSCRYISSPCHRCSTKAQSTMTLDEFPALRPPLSFSTPSIMPAAFSNWRCKTVLIAVVHAAILPSPLPFPISPGAHIHSAIEVVVAQGHSFSLSVTVSGASNIKRPHRSCCFCRGRI